MQYSKPEHIKREIKIQKKLHHAHVLRMLQYFEDNKNVYLVLEYAPNGSLFTYLKRRKKFQETEAFIYFF